jgi:prophage regulatory protein
MRDRLIRLSEVTELTSLAKSTIYKYIQLGRFPQQKGGLYRVALWRESEVQQWIASNSAHSD